MRLTVCFFYLLVALAPLPSTGDEATFDTFGRGFRIHHRQPAAGCGAATWSVIQKLTVPGVNGGQPFDFEAICPGGGFWCSTAANVLGPCQTINAVAFEDIFPIGCVITHTFTQCVVPSQAKCLILQGTIGPRDSTLTPYILDGIFWTTGCAS